MYISQDGRKGRVQYTLCKGITDRCYRYFVVPEDVATGEFIPGFYTREEAVSWWTNNYHNPKSFEVPKEV